MEGNKLEISGRVAADPPPASYKQLPDGDADDRAAQRPKSLTKSQKSSTEMDGADEQMLPKDEKNAIVESKLDMEEVKLGSNEKQNGDAKLDIGEVNSAFVGMSKEELMKYANDPFWVRLRLILFIAFWLLWLAMLVGAIVIIVVAPKCSPPAPRTWWEQGPLTEVSHNIPQEKLQEIKEHKIKGVIVPNPLDSYRPANDSADVINFITRAKELEINVIVELEPAASELWFEKSEKKEEPYNDYYIWQPYKSPDNGTGSPVPPNNWLSPNGGSAWKYSESRQEFYYAPHNSPHLNFRNPSVVDEFSTILRQWIGAGAKGIRLRGAPYLLVDDRYENESMSSQPGFVHTDYEFYKHTHTVNVEGIGDILKEWKTIVHEHNDNGGPLMIAEDLVSLDAYFANETLSIDLPRHSHMFFSDDKLSNATQIFNSMKSAYNVLKDYWPLWQYNNSLTALSSDVLNMVTMLLPGCSLVSSDTHIDPQLLQIREVPSVMFGSCHRQLLANDSVFAYLRVAPGNPGYLVACNPSERLVTVDFTAMHNVSEEVTIQVLSNNYTIPDMKLNYKIPANAVAMPAKSAIVLTYVPKSPE